jgi:hypothetical protein
MDAAANGVAEEQDEERGIDQQDVLYRMVFFLATVTVRLFSRVLGADNAPFRPVMSKRGEPLKDPLILYDGKGFGDHARLL